MHHLDDLLPDGTAARDAVAARASPRSVARWTGSGALLRPLPGVVVLPSSAGDWHTRARAAVLWSGGALSHRSALMAWGALEDSSNPVHVTIAARRNKRRGEDVVVHRTTRPTLATTVAGHRATLLPRSLVDAWTDAHAATRPRSAVPAVRHAVIESARRGRVTVEQIRAESRAQSTHRGRAGLTTLLDLVEGGCQSELEIWSVLHVVVIPGLPAPVQQRRVVMPGRRVYLDVAYVDAMVAVELDGAAFHGSRQQREDDIHRDTELAVLGWVVLRFSWARLTHDPEGCRRDIEAVVRRRLASR